MNEIKASSGRIVVLGRRKENQARCVTFDISEWHRLYGEGTVQLLAQRCQDPTPYPCVVEAKGSTVRWEIREADVAVPGEGKAELQYHVGETVAVSDTYRTWALPSLCEAGPVPPDPEKDWVDTVLQAARDAEQSAQEAKAAKQDISIGENGNWHINGEDTGVSASGESGPAGPAPVRGEDYWTDEDKAGIVADVMEAIPDSLHVVDATKYGAAGDGITNDAPALNALILELAAKPYGGTIYLPAGTYMLGSQLTWKSNVSLIGDGVGKTILQTRKDEGAENFPAIGFSWDDGWGSGNPVLNCNFRDFTIDGGQWEDENGNKFGYVMGAGEYSVSAKGIFILYMQNCTFENLRIKNTGATGLGIDFLRNVTINKVHCYNCGRAYKVVEGSGEGVIGSAGIGIATMGMPTESCVITDCIADACGNYGIFVEGTNENALYRENGKMATKASFTIANCHCINGRNYGIVVKSTHNVVVANNICRNNARDGFALLNRDVSKVNTSYCDNVSVVGNQFLNNGSYGIRIYDTENCHSNIAISDNLVEGNGHFGIALWDTAIKNLAISNNIISHNLKEGLYLKDKPDVPLEDVLVQGNHIHHNGSDGLLISGDLSNTTFIGNNIQYNGNRGIAIGNGKLTNVAFYSNVAANNVNSDWMMKGKPFGPVRSNQAVHAIYPMEIDWVSGYLDDNGVLQAKESSFVAEDYFYCGGSTYAGFNLEAPGAGTGNRIVGCSFYDGNKAHMGRYFNTTANPAGQYTFTVPAGAKYVRFRIGYSESVTSEAAVLSEATLLISATDRV